MPYTSHGHWYGPGTPTEPRPRLIAKCGGPGICADCAAETRRMPAGLDPEPLNGRVFRVDDDGRLWVERADPDKPCPHEAFESFAAVARLTPAEGQPPNGYSVSLRIICAQCREPFRFIGTPAGVLADRPACSVDETELRAPIRPASSDPDFGLGLPGFAIRLK